MKIILPILFSLCVSFKGRSQVFYGVGLKAQKVNLFSVHETDEDFKYDLLTDTYTFIDGLDTNQQNFLSIGPTIFYGYSFDLTDRISLGPEFNVFIGMINSPGSRSYVDAGLGLRGAFLLKSNSYSNVFGRIGIGYGREHNLFSSFRNMVGFNWRLGYEHDIDDFLVGCALESNVFLTELSSSAKSKEPFLLERRMYTIGVVLYLKFDSFSTPWY